MKILLFGKNGQVGWELSRSLQSLGEIIALGSRDADFSNPESIRGIVREVKPEVIVNAAAYTAVDKAEEEEGLALLINGESPKVLAEEALTINALLVHYSTDYVFDGAKSSPYVEADIPNPVNAYGRTKLAGEQAIQASGCNYLILRTSWVYSSRGHNFLLSMLRLASEREELRIVADQVGTPTTARLIAEISNLVIRKSLVELERGDFKSNLYHLVSSGEASWFEFALKIIEGAKKIHQNKMYKVKLIKPISTENYLTPATRPSNSRLSSGRLIEKFNVVLPDWQADLERTLQEIV